jgi:hypothetical protein
MFSIVAHKGSGRVLRRIWYLTERPCVELRSRWVVDNLSTSAPNADPSRNSAVTMAWETEWIVECA